MSELGRLEDLPLDYRQGLMARNLVPLWPALRAALPYGIPSRRTKPILWRYADVRPQLLEAGRLTPIEKAERRVLVLANPGLGLDNMQATPSIYIGMQLILAGRDRSQPSPFAVGGAFRGRGRGRLHHRRGREVPDGAGRPDPDARRGSGTSTVMPAPARSSGWTRSICRWSMPSRRPTGIEGKPRRRCATKRTDRTDALSPLRPRCPTAAMTRPRANYPLVRFPWREVNERPSQISPRVTPRGEAGAARLREPGDRGMECMPILGFSAICGCGRARACGCRVIPRPSVINVVDGSPHGEDRRGRARLRPSSTRWRCRPMRRWRSPTPRRPEAYPSLRRRRRPDAEEARLLRAVRLRSIGRDTRRGGTRRVPPLRRFGSGGRACSPGTVAQRGEPSSTPCAMLRDGRPWRPPQHEAFVFAEKMYGTSS